MKASLNIYVWDNGGETVDRYTIVVEQLGFEQVAWYGCSAEPLHPQGIGQFSHESLPPVLKRETKHLGKLIPYHALPEMVQRYIRQLINYEE